MKDPLESKTATKRFFTPLLLSLPFVAIILSISYPGFMSYDPIHMVREARGTVEGGIYPTLPVYIFRLFDVFGNGNELLFVSQVFLVYFLVNLIIWRVTGSRIWALLVSLILTLSPVLAGAIMVLWKDVTLTVLFLSSAAIIFLHSREVEPSKLASRLLKWLAFGAIFLTAGMRLNAIPLSIALVIYWLKVYYPGYSLKKVVAFATLLSLALLGFTQFLGAIRLPDLAPLKPSTNAYATMAADLLGMSRFSDRPLVPFDVENAQVAEKMDKSEIDRIYSNLGLLVMQNNAESQGIELRIFPEAYENSDITRAWVGAITREPFAYFAYRSDLMSAIMGATSERPYEPTHYNTIDENDLGIEFKMRTSTFVGLAYVWVASGWFFFKPWFYLCLGGLALLGIRKNQFTGGLRSFSLFLFLSGLAYLAPFSVIAATGEVRYAFPSTLLFLLSTSIALWVRLNNDKDSQAFKS